MPLSSFSKYVYLSDSVFGRKLKLVSWSKMEFIRRLSGVGTRNNLVQGPY